MASWAVLGVPAATCGPVTMMSAAAASKGEKKPDGLLDFLNGALNKEAFSEMDPILQKVEGAPPRPSAAPKKASPPSKKPTGGSNGGSGGGLFGLFGKK